MPGPRKIFEKLPFLTNGDVMVGLTFVVAGIIIFYSGITKLWDLWSKLYPFLPLRLQANVGELILRSLPLVFTYFISTVAALSASLLGILWLLVGLGDAIRRKGDSPEPAEYKHPEMTAESLMYGQAVQWRDFSWFFKFLARRWTRVRYISPVSLDVFRDIVRASLKVVFIWVVILLMFYGFHLIPDLAKRALQMNVKLVIPSPLPLYTLLAIALFFNILIAASLVPLRIPQFVGSKESFSVRGRGDPHLFFALLEESCKLLSPKGPPDRQPVRLYHEDNVQVKGTLIESRPEAMFTVSRPGAFFCLPLIAIFLCVGFSRLINFNRPLPEIQHMDFLSGYLLDYLLEVAFALGLILLGIYFSEWARRLFGLRKFRSLLVFCHLEPPQHQDTTASGQTRPSSTSDRPSGIPWHVSEGVDAKFAAWAKDPRTARRFQVDLDWAEASSESMDESSPRFLVGTRKSGPLDDLMARIVSLPFHVAFETAETALRDKPMPERPPSERGIS